MESVADHTREACVQEFVDRTLGGFKSQLEDQDKEVSYLKRSFDAMRKTLSDLMSVFERDVSRLRSESVEKATGMASSAEVKQLWGRMAQWEETMQGFDVALAEVRGQLLPGDTLTPRSCEAQDSVETFLAKTLPLLLRQHGISLKLNAEKPAGFRPPSVQEDPIQAAMDGKPAAVDVLNGRRPLACCSQRLALTKPVAARHLQGVLATKERLGLATSGRASLGNTPVQGAASVMPSTPSMKDVGAWEPLSAASPIAGGRDLSPRRLKGGLSLTVGSASPRQNQEDRSPSPGRSERHGLCLPRRVAGRIASTAPSLPAHR